jgi:CBS-domain-containing membrane protein
MIGAAAFFSAFFGTPIAAAVLVWEMTQNPYLLFPAWIAAMIAIEVRKRLGRDSFNEEDMRRRGLTIQGGRRLQILEKLKVGDAMVRDFQAVMDTESIADLHSRILAARYPYLPVINAAGAYLGLITVDSIQDAWQAHDPQAAHIPLAHLLEAKDLLYRTTVKPPLIKEDDRMAKVISLLEAFPCLPVLGPQKQVIGLLLGHHVRLAYESESARSLLIPQHLKI